MTRHEKSIMPSNFTSFVWFRKTEAHPFHSQKSHEHTANGILCINSCFNLFSCEVPGFFLSLSLSRFGVAQCAFDSVYLSRMFYSTYSRSDTNIATLLVSFSLSARFFFFLVVNLHLSKAFIFLLLLLLTMTSIFVHEKKSTVFCLRVRL